MSAPPRLVVLSRKADYYSLPGKHVKRVWTKFTDIIQKDSSVPMSKQLSQWWWWGETDQTM